VFEEREKLCGERQMTDDVEARLEAQTALVVAQELALKGYARDYERLALLDAERHQIEQTLTWRAHRRLARFRVVKIGARLARTALKLRR
jgi:hypothetical protein